MLNFQHHLLLNSQIIDSLHAQNNIVKNSAVLVSKLMLVVVQCVHVNNLVQLIELVKENVSLAMFSIQMVVIVNANAKKLQLLSNLNQYAHNICADVIVNLDSKLMKRVAELVPVMKCQIPQSLSQSNQTQSSQILLEDSSKIKPSHSS